jgi:ATPase subunit of ABC transporter with duplicated ATPase domains
LIAAPDLLLLDEPTNNLDADGRQAVAQLLERWQGGVLLASHDRALLERVDRMSN